MLFLGWWSQLQMLDSVLLAAIQVHNQRARAHLEGAGGQGRLEVGAGGGEVEEERVGGEVRAGPGHRTRDSQQGAGVENELLRLG